MTLTILALTLSMYIITEIIIIRKKYKRYKHDKS
jgi:hypothetical protein